MLERLTSTTFSSGPNDLISAIDAYKTDTAATVNALPDITDRLDPNALGIIKSGSPLKDTDIQKLLNEANAKTGLLKVNADSLLKGIISANSGLMSSLKGLSPELQTKLLAGGGNSNISATMGGITKIISNANLSNLSGLGSMIGSLSGATLPLNFVDKSGLTSLSTNLVREASNAGIPGAFTAFSSSLSDKSIVSGMVRNLTPDIIKTSNTNLLVEISNTEHSSELLTHNPDFASEFISTYTVESGLSDDEEIIEYQKISDSLTKVDPEWQTCRATTYEDTTAISLNDRVTEYEKISESLRVVSPDNPDAVNITMDERLVEYEKISASLKEVKVDNSGLDDVSLDERLADFKKTSASLRDIEEAEADDAMTPAEKKLIFDDLEVSCKASEFKYTAGTIFTAPDVSIDGSIFGNISPDFKKLLSKAATVLYNPMVLTNPSNVNTAQNTGVDRYLVMASQFGNPTALQELKRCFPSVIFQTQY